MLLDDPKGQNNLSMVHLLCHMLFDFAGVGMRVAIAVRGTNQRGATILVPSFVTGVADERPRHPAVPCEPRDFVKPAFAACQHELAITTPKNTRCHGRSRTIERIPTRPPPEHREVCRQIRAAI